MQEMQEWAIQVRFGQNLFAAIEGWRRKQETIPSRPEAIRELVRQSLADTDLAAQRGKP
jgi:metal-responsive CopG/Arc/MetJ family transcriptional regulator